MHQYGGFVPGRLRQALRRARQTSAALAAALDVADNTVSRYLSGQLAPRPDHLRMMAAFFGEPLGFFLSPLPLHLDSGSGSFMRSYAAATKRARLSAEALKDRTREVTAYLDRYLELPEVKFPSFRFGDDPAAVSWRDIERVAMETRRFWALGDGPIANVVRLLEHHGAIVVRVDLGEETLDAFSQWGQPDERPYIILGNGKGSPVRSRFDAAHEIAHMTLHRHLPREIIADPNVHKLLERQANHFAGALLMPAESFTKSVYLTTLAAFRELKGVWRTSVASMIMRARELDLISERQEKRLWESYAPWRRNGEPGDDEVPMEMPSTVREAFEVLRTECGIPAAQISADIPFTTSDVAAIGGLPLGYFRDESPRIRVKSQPTTILEFRAKSN
jgi:Zn-dependent peptidase ImmA (M78 family)/transcriptional regulator with XRE-family HTH domain